MKRRDFIAGVGSTAASPLVALAQEKMRRVGALLPATKDNSEFQSWVKAFQDELHRLGWDFGRTMEIDVRWTPPDPANIRKQAKELVALTPDAILAHGALTVAPLLQETSSVPIVFPVIADPVSAGFVKTLARPGGNATGFMNFEYSIGGKWAELLKEIAPHVTRAAVLRDSATPTGMGQFGVIQTVAPSLGIEIVPVDLREPGEIESAIATFARTPNGGLIATSVAQVSRHRDLIVGLAKQHKLPAIYTERAFATIGGLLSYGPNFINLYRQAAGYIDRILKGERPNDLPVQLPTRYEIAINLTTAKAIGLTVPLTLLARADELIE